MIINKSGRTFSRRTPAEEENMLLKELKSLSPAERETLELLLSELKDSPPEETVVPEEGVEVVPPPLSLIDAMGQAEYKRTPVDMHTFVTDPYFLGHTCDNIYPKLLEDLAELFEGGYHECIWTGSIGYGKTSHVNNNIPPVSIIKRTG